jgi:hypothetical protein
LPLNNEKIVPLEKEPIRFVADFKTNFSGEGRLEANLAIQGSSSYMFQG